MICFLANNLSKKNIKTTGISIDNATPPDTNALIGVNRLKKSAKQTNSVIILFIKLLFSFKMRNVLSTFLV